MGAGWGRMYFTSPSRGVLGFEQMFSDIMDFVAEDPDASYKLIIGTDSQVHEDVLFVTAVIIHRLGKGGRYYFTRRRERKMPSLRQRIFYEVALSLGVASRLAERLAENGSASLDVEIHLDVGRNGETRDMIREVVGMVTGTGFDAKIKPNSYGASKVADKYAR